MRGSSLSQTSKLHVSVTCAPEQNSRMALMCVSTSTGSTVPFAGPDGTVRVCAARVAIAQTRRTGPSRLSSAVT